MPGGGKKFSRMEGNLDDSLIGNASTEGPESTEITGVDIVMNNHHLQ